MNKFRKYIIFNTSELNVINFEEVMETSADTVRKSVDQTKTFVKWDERTVPVPAAPVELDENGMPVPVADYVAPELIPDSIKSLTTKIGPYTHAEFITILSGTDWTDPNPEYLEQEA